MCGRAYKTYTEEALYFQYLSKHPLDLIDLRLFTTCAQRKTRLSFDSSTGNVSSRRCVGNSSRILSPRSRRSCQRNAKSETVFDSRLFADLVVRRRCVVPLSGFFEWKADGQRKRPFKIHLQSKAIMSVAGLSDTWRPGTPYERHSFTILTTNKFTARFTTECP
jgi:putative SOS response-associated peptidase YedK